jgi:hypothetical protein
VYEQIQINSKLKTGKKGQQTADWESPLRRQGPTLNCSAIGGGRGGERKKRKKGRRRRSVSGYLNAATRLQLAGIGTPFLAELRFFRAHTRGKANTGSYVIDTGGSYPKMWNTHSIKLTSHLHLTLRLRMHGATPQVLHTYSWHTLLLLYLSNK